jgi:hypothetical protein
MRTVIAMFASTCALAACAAPPPGGDEAQLAEAASALATPEDVEHACLHASFGPFRTVSASSSYATATANVNREHTAFNVRLPTVGRRRQGVVVYAPAEGGEHAFFVNPDVPVTLYDAATNATVPVVSRQSIAPAECPTLSALVTYDLVGGKAYKLAFGPTAATTVLTVIENVDEPLGAAARKRPPGRPAGGRAATGRGGRRREVRTMRKLHAIRLSDEERARLEYLSSGEGAPERTRLAARALLLADAGRGDEAIAYELGLSTSTLWRLRKRAASEGPLAALERRRPRRPRNRVLDAAGEECLRSLAGGPPPPGRSRWTLSLLAERLVELGVVERVCYETVRQVLKRERSRGATAPPAGAPDSAPPARRAPGT